MGPVASVAPLWHCHACHSASQNPEWRNSRRLTGLTSSCGLAATGTDCRDSSHNVCAPLGSGCSATRQHGDVGVPEALNVQPTRQPLLHRSLRTALPPSAATLDAYARAHGLGKNAPLPASNYLKDGTRRAELCVRVRDNPNSHPPPVTRRELCIGKS
jgi:hypothetical protein